MLVSPSSVPVPRPAAAAPGEGQEGYSRLSEVSVYYEADEAPPSSPASPVVASFPSFHEEHSQPVCAPQSPTILATPVARSASLRSSNSTIHRHSVSSAGTQVVVAKSPHERTHSEHSLPPPITQDAHDDDGRSSHSTQSVLTDVSSNSGESSDDGRPSPLTPTYDELPGAGAGVISARIQGARDAALRALESRDSIKRPSSGFDDSPPGSPSFPFGSPRPDQELPSFANSLSAPAPLTASSHPPTSRFSSMLSPHQFPSRSEASVEELRSLECSIPSVEVTPAPSPSIIRRAGERRPLEIDIPSASSTSRRSELVFDLTEPSSPDEDNFTPHSNIIMFAAPDTAQLELTFPGIGSEDPLYNPLAIRNLERSRISGTRSSPHVRQLSRGTDDIRLEGASVEERQKGSFFNKFKTIKDKMRKIFNSDSASAKVRSRSRGNSTASELVSPHTPSYLVSLQLPPHGTVHGTSPTLASFGRSADRSADLDSLQLPAFTLTDAPDSAPPPRGTRFATVTAVPQTPRRSRRFSLQPGIFTRARARSESRLSAMPNSTHLGVPDDEEATQMRHSPLSAFNIGAMLSKEALRVPSIPAPSEPAPAPPQERTPAARASFIRRPVSRQLGVNHDEILEVRRSTCGLEDELSAGRDLRNRMSVISSVR